MMMREFVLKLLFASRLMSKATEARPPPRQDVEDWRPARGELSPPGGPLFQALGSLERLSAPIPI